MLLINKKHNKRANQFIDEHEYREILQEVTKTLGEAEKE